jgi:hypothetical protein
MRRRIAIILAAALLAYAAAEVAALAGLEFLKHYSGVQPVGEAATLTKHNTQALRAFVERGQGRFMQMDPELGWVPGQRRGETKIYDALNSAGMRDDREYDKQPAPDSVRIAAFGESFTYGNEVQLGENWAKLMPELEPALEVLNYGVGGYGVDQAFLRYLKVGGDFQPDIVLIGYMSENMARSVSVYRPFLFPQTVAIYSKPRFLLENGKLVLLPNPLRNVEDYRRLLENPRTELAALGRRDAYYQEAYPNSIWHFSPLVRLVKTTAARQYQPGKIHRDENGVCDPESEAFQLTLTIMDAFYRQVLADGRLPVIVIFPYRYDFERALAGQSLHYGPFLEALRANGCVFIDTFNAFLPVTSSGQIDAVIDRHFTPEGNRIVAEYLVDALRKNHLTNRCAVREAVQTERVRLGITSNPKTDTP